MKRIFHYLQRMIAAFMAMVNRLRCFSPKKALVYTIDSGFGGYFVAKSLEKAIINDFLPHYNADVAIHHFGDTANVPYGEKLPEQIVSLMSGHIAAAFVQNAHTVVVACNTASTQEAAIRQALQTQYGHRQKDVLFLLDATVQYMYEYIQKRLPHRSQLHIILLATPLTIRSAAYSQCLAKKLSGTCTLGQVNEYADTQVSDQRMVTSLTRHDVIVLPNQKKIHLYNMAPASWVDLVEGGANLHDRTRVIQRDLARVMALLPHNVSPDALGEFCTHYPVLHSIIALSMRDAGMHTIFYMQQGNLMAKALLKHLKKHHIWVKRTKQHPVNLALARPVVMLSGTNLRATLQAVRTMYPHDPLPVVHYSQTPQAMTVAASSLLHEGSLS